MGLDLNALKKAYPVDKKADTMSAKAAETVADDIDTAAASLTSRMSGMYETALRNSESATDPDQKKFWQESAARMKAVEDATAFIHEELQQVVKEPAHDGPVSFCSQ